MTHDLYQVWAGECPTPVTIYARDREQATRVFTRWAALHRPLWNPTPTKISGVPAQRLFEEPSLGDAAYQAAAAGLDSAIIYYHDRTVRWMARAPDDPASEPLAPPYERVHAYEVYSVDAKREVPELLLCAHDIVHALEIYRAWRQAQHQPVDHPYRIRSIRKWKLKGTRAMLRALMEQGQVGVAHWTSRQGWALLSPTGPRAL